MCRVPDFLFSWVGVCVMLFAICQGVSIIHIGGMALFATTMHSGCSQVWDSWHGGNSCFVGGWSIPS